MRPIHWLLLGVLLGYVIGKGDATPVGRWIKTTKTCFDHTTDTAIPISFSDLDKCKRQCNADVDCGFIHWFEGGRNCFMFPPNCTMNNKLSGWAKRILTINSSWKLINTTETFSSSITQSLPTITETELSDNVENTVASHNSGGDDLITTRNIWLLYICIPLAVFIILSQRWKSSSSTAIPIPENTEICPPKSWQRGKLLGRGSFAKVFLGVCPDGSMIAVKVILLGGNLKDEQLNTVTKEFKIISGLQHPRIVCSLGCRYDISENELHIFMEYMPGGSLGHLVRRLGTPLKESAAIKYIRQTLEGLRYLHAKELLHRDIKGDNILLGADGNVKLGDFGTCIHYDSEITYSTGVVGTPLWMAPEIISNMSHTTYTDMSDIWSTGIVCYEVLNEGDTPWPIFDNHLQAMFYISCRTMPLLCEFPVQYSGNCNSFLELCLNPDPKKRASARMLLHHPWLNSQSVSEATCPSPVCI